MLPPGNLALAKTPEARLRAFSHELWDEVAAGLAERTQINIGYMRCGSIELDDGHLAKRTPAWQSEGLPFEKLDRRQLERFIPNAHSSFQSAVHLPNFGQVRNLSLIHI